MKLLLPLCLTLLLAGNVFSQDIDSRLLERYSSTELSALQSSNPARIALMTYALDNALYITDVPSGKEINAETITVNSESLPTYIELGLEIKNENQYFMIAGQNKMLVMKSEWVLNHEMKKQ